MPEYLCQPERTGRPVGGAAATKLVSHQQMRVAAQQDLRQTAPQQVLEVQSRRRRWHVHAHVHHPGQFGARGGDEGAERAFGFDQLPPPGLGIGAGHGRQIHAERPGETALRRHAVSCDETPLADCPLDEIDDLQIPCATAAGDLKIPFGIETGCLHGFHGEKVPRCMGFVFS
ncbi:hypothetical protein D3C72_1705160 [compost metagenome]